MRTINIRAAQAKKYWDLGLGEALGYECFPDFLAAVPEIPAELRDPDERFPLLVLVLPRNDKLTLTALCQKVGVTMLAAACELAAYDADHEDFAHMRWTRVHDGRKNRSMSVLDCCLGFQDKERGVTAFQAACAVALYPQMVADMDGSEGQVHAMDIPGSVHVDGRGSVVYLGKKRGRLLLNYASDDHSSPWFGSASLVSLP